MAHRSQCSSAGDNPLDSNYLPPHYREEYRMAIDALVDADLEGYYGFLQEANVVDFLSHTEIEYIKCTIRAPNQTAQPERRYMAEDADGSSDTYWPVHSDHDAPSLDLGWPQQFRFVGPTEVTTLVNPPDPEMPSIKEQVRRMIKNAQQVIAVVMDMFTDVDIFADILGAAARGVAVYVLLDELNAQHFVAMVNNCRVNLDEIKCMRVRTVSGSTYFCHTGKTFKGQMMDRFILVDCRAVLSGNYSFMWSFEKIHRCLAHLFLGQLVSTFDEEFRILFAHSEPLVVENVLANMPQYSSEPESYYNTEKTVMFNRQHPTVNMDWPERTAAVHMNVGPKMLPYRSESMHSAPETNPPIPRHMNMHAPQQYRGDHQFIEHGRPMRGPTEMVGYKRHSYGNLPDFEYMSPQNHPMRGNQYMEETMSHGGHFAREPHIYQGPGLQTGYDMYGKFRGQGLHIDPLSGSGYPPEVDEAEPTGGYDHVQRYLQSHTAMEEGHAPRQLLPPVQSGLKRHSMGHSYTCQTSPTQPNQQEQKRFFNVNRKPQDLSQKQGMRDWRISSYLSTCEDGGELDLAELEGSSASDEVPCFTQEVPCGPLRPEIRPGNRELNRIPSPRENLMPVQIQNDSVVPVSSLNIKSTPTSTSESSCTTEGDKAEETQNTEPKETNRISEDFLKRKPSRPVMRSSRLRHSLIFSSNLELNTPEEMKDTAGEKDGDEASKLSARVSHILDKRRTGSPFQPFQWSNFTKSATFDNSVTESAEPEDELSKTSEKSDLKNPQNLQKKPIEGAQQEKDLPQTTVPEGNSKRMESPSNVLQKSSSLTDMNDPDCRLRYFKELAAKRKLAAAKTSQNNPVKATQKFALPEKPANNDTDKKAVFKTPDTPLKLKTTAVAAEIKETYKEESSKDILQRATDAEKIRFKKKLAEESGATCSGSKHFFQEVTESTLKPVEEAKTMSTVKNCDASSQNQVSSVTFNTASTHSAPTQYHIEKETEPCQGVLKESGLHIKLPQTKSMSPISTPPNKGCLSENDSQTLAQSSLCISSTCSNNVSLNSSSTSNLAIVDKYLPSKSDHRVTSPFPALSTTEVSSAQELTSTYACSPQSLSEPERNKNSSQQYISKQTHPIIIEGEAFQKSTSLKAGSSQPPLALETECPQQPTALRECATELTISTESKTSQNLPITTQTTDSVQHPTAEKGELSLTPTTIKISSSQQSVTEEYSFQPPAETETDSTEAQSKTTIPTTAMETDTSAVRTSNKPSQQCTASDSAKRPPGLWKNSSEQPTSTEMDSIESSTSEFPLQHTAKESELSLDPTTSDTQSFIQPNPSVAAPSQHLNATETDSSQNSTASTTDYSQQPTATATDSSQHCTAITTNSSHPLTATATESSQHSPASSSQSTAKVTESSQNSTVTGTDSSQQPASTEADSAQLPIVAEVDSSQQILHAATETDHSQQYTAPITDSSEQPTAVVTNSLQGAASKEVDSFQQPAGPEVDNALKFTAPDTVSSQKPSATQNASSFTSVASDIESFQQPAARETDCFQHPTPTEAHSPQQLSTTETDSLQKPPATVTDFCQHPAPPGTNSSQQPAPSERDSSEQTTPTVTDKIEADSSQQPILIEAKSSQQSIIIEANSSQQYTAPITDSSEQPTAAVTNSFQQHPSREAHSLQEAASKEVDSSQQPAGTEVDNALNFTALDTDSSQKPSATHNVSSVMSVATEIESFQQPAARETDCFQQPTPTEAHSPQQPFTTVTDFCQHTALPGTNTSQQPAPSERDSSEQTTPTVTGKTEAESSQEITLTEANSSQQTTPKVVNSSLQTTKIESDFSQQTTLIEANSSQQTTLIEANSSQQTTLIEANFSPQTTVTETDSSQQTTVIEANSSQQTTATEIDSFQLATEIKANSSPQTTATETDSSQQTTVIEANLSQQLTLIQADSSKQPTATETKSFHQSGPVEAESSQYLSATDTDSSQQLTATKTKSSHQSAPVEADSTHQPTATETHFSQQTTATETKSSQQITVVEADASQQPAATEIGSSERSTATETDSSQQTTLIDADSSQQPAATGTDSSEKSTATETDSSQQTILTNTDSFQHTILTEANSSLKPTAVVTGSFQQPVAVEVDSTKQLIVTEHVCSQNISKKGEDTSKHPIETENKSHQSSDCADEKKDIIVSKDLSKVLSNSLVSFGQLTGLDAVDVSSTQPQVLPEPCQSSNEMNSNQDSTEFQSNISSNFMESSCPDDPKPEKTDECQKNETITMQPQKNDTSAIAPGNEIPYTDVSTVIDPNEVDEIKQTSSEKENSVSDFSEVSEKSNLTVTHNSENQSTVADSPKLILSAHQSSTANVISCSNLRDDTKVLLEQISAKNQSRSTQSKQTLSSPNEAKEGEVKSAYKPLSKYSGRPWSEKATAEEREMLLQKMEKMRKERKVYSRFEAS